MTIFEHWRSTVRLPCLLAAILGLGISSQTVEAATVGELHRVTAEPTAALRDAQHRTDVRVTVWYPAAPEAIERPIGIGPADRPLFEVGSAAPNAPFGPGAQSYPTVLLSHGFGGTARSVGWFGIALARAGFMVVSVDHPGNNSVDPMTASSTLLPWDRVADLRAALAAIKADPVTGPHIDLERLGVAGFSAGGFTALVAAGAQVDWDHLQTFCSSNPEDGVCMPQREFPSVSAADVASAKADPAVQVEIRRAASDHAIPGVRAAFVMAPALVQALDPASLLKVSVPTEIVLGDADRVAPPSTNGLFAGERIPGAKIVVLPGVGHYDFVATCTAAGVAVVPLCTNSVPQSTTHEQAVTAAVAFFERSLGPPR